jgi:hypothetical protein
MWSFRRWSIRPRPGTLKSPNHQRFAENRTDTHKNAPKNKLSIAKVGVNYKFDWGKQPVVARY